MAEAAVSVQDYHESFTKEAEAAQVMREVLKRSPEFKMVNFLRSVKEDVSVAFSVVCDAPCVNVFAGGG